MTRAVLGEISEVERQPQQPTAPESAPLSAVPLPLSAEEQKLVEQQSRTQEEIIDQIVAQQTDQNEHQLEAEVAG